MVCGRERRLDAHEPAAEGAAEGVLLLLDFRGDGQLQVLAAALYAEHERPFAVYADDPLHVLEALDRPAVDAGDHVARLKACRRRRHVGHDLAHNRSDRAHADRQVDARVDGDREQEVGNRAGADDGGALPQGLGLERTAALLRRHVGERLRRGLARGVLVIEKLDVAAERDPGEAPARALAVGEAEDLPAEADGERLDRYPAPARDDEVAELVHEHDDAQHEHEGDDRAEDSGRRGGQIH